MRLIRVLLMSVMAMLSIVAVAQDEALMWAEQLPQFPGGTQALAESIAANITYPDNCPSFDGKVVVQFVVTKTGDIGEVKVSRTVDPVLDSIAIAAVKQLPRFIPGQQDGKPVDVWFSLPIKFKTEEQADNQIEEDPNVYIDSLGIKHTIQPPQFPGGEKALKQFLSKNIRYPSKSSENLVDGRVLVKLLVAETGKIEEIKIARSASKELDAEAVRVCKKLPNFIPGTMDGKPTKAWCALTISFKQPEMSQSEEADYWFYLGYSYLYGKNGHLIDKIEARRCLKRASDLGHPYADTLLEAMR